MFAEKSAMNRKPTTVPVLCVDLDGTLLATDLLWESILRLVKRKLHLVLALPFWLVQGKAYLKRRLTAYISIDPTTLPYRDEIISFLADEKKSGRKIVLVTASDRRAAESIARHLGLFHEVLASDAAVNLAGTKKRQVLESRFGHGGFDYIGNSMADVAVWESANAALLVEPSNGILKKATSVSSIQRVFPAKSSRLRAIIRAMRCHQWLKNILIFVPLLMSHKLLQGELVLRCFVAFVAMSLCASSIYIINDFLDLEADRQHPRKRLRPFAAGTLSIAAGVILAATIGIGGFVFGWMILPANFTWLLMGYVALTLSYSMLLKSKVVADVIALALLYMLRILIGGAAVEVPISPWLLALSVFLFLSLAFVKRFGEIDVLKNPILSEIPGRGYIADDKEWMRNMGGTSGYLSILVLALYINNPEVTTLYSRPEFLWLACPPLLYWISRIWLLAARGKVEDDPLVFAAQDRVSYAVGIIVVAAIVAAI
jgi:4-hydroxybenzoate polyprenyltransferase/phosphoserine phosphatase